MAGKTVKPQPISAGLRAIIDASRAATEPEAPTKWVSASIDAALDKVEEFRVDPGWIHPSSLTTKCDSQLAFRYLGTAADADYKVPARTRRIFDMGHGRDQSIKGYVSLAGLSVIPRTDSLEKDALLRKIELPLYKIRGEFDDRIRNPVTREEHILEIKTKNDALFKKLREPDEGHVIQVQPYLVATGLKSAYVLYENKNDQTLEEFKVPFDPALWANITDRIHLMLLRMDEGLQPAADYTACNTCPFRKTCFSMNWRSLKQ